MAEIETVVLEQLGLGNSKLDDLALIIWLPRETLARE